MKMKKVAIILILLLLVVIAVVLFYIIRSPPKIEVVDVSTGTIREQEGKILIEVKYWEHFNITFKTSPKYAGYKIVCFCDSINFTHEHPLKGRECGGYGVVDDNGYCISTGWVADTPPGFVTGMKCYLVNKGRRIEGSGLEIYFKTVEEG
ncbi:MAG: hypothetical protein DRN90_04285 [Thermoproteota archaeon]|nr:MAG: hypothetical protein DRN90_04285 [Candidatus Korarchaeota archaeon]